LRQWRASAWWRSLPALFVAGLVITAIKIALRAGLGQLVPGLPTMPLRVVVLAQFHIQVATFWVILGIGAAFEYYAKFRERELRASQLESRLAQADESIREAFKRAREQSAKSLELRAATSLVLLRRDQHAPDDGRADLADLVESFVDGAGTPDVDDARAVLRS